MTLRRCTILFLLLAAAAAIVKLTLTGPNMEVLIDVTLIAAVACFLISGIGYFGRQMGEIVDRNDQDRDHPGHTD